MFHLLPGEFIGAGGEGGSSAEHGGPGTTYLHLLPEIGADRLLDGTTYVVTDTSEHDGVHSNRTLYIDNRCLQLTRGGITFAQEGNGMTTEVVLKY